jgi:uncharacterized protein (TIGR02217 family)
MSFIEERLDLGITYGTIATLATKTTIIEEGGGAEQRTIDWEQPMLKFAIGQRGCINDELEYFIEFHQERKGAYEAFRFKDWSDWRVDGGAIGTGDGTTTEFQLFKIYSVAGQAVKRPITKPVAGTLTVYVAGTVTSLVTVNTATGLITFASAPTGAITADFEFDVPVRFEGDEIKLRFESFEPGTGRKIFNWEGLTLVEVRIPPAIPLPIDSIPQSLDHTIDLGYDYGTIGGNRFETRIDKLVSGYENRASNWENPKGSWEIGQRTLDLSELEYLIALFRVCRGRAIAFRYLDRAEIIFRNVRFGEDSISFRFDAYERGPGRVIFDLSGVPLAGVVAPVCAPREFSFVDNFESGFFFCQENLQIYNGASVANASADFVPAGGDPGGYVAIRLDYGGTPGGGVGVSWINRGFVYIPAHPDENLFFRLVQRSKSLATSAPGQQGYGLCVEQSGNYYYRGAQSPQTSDWQEQSIVATPADMGFSVIPGVPLFFGFLRSESNAPSVSNENFYIVAIDSFSIEISVSCPL